MGARSREDIPRLLGYDKPLQLNFLGNFSIIHADLLIQVIAIRENQDTKRYDFEAQSVADAAEIVEEIQKGMEPYDQQHQGMM